MPLHDDAEIVVVLADHVAVDEAGGLHMLGAFADVRTIDGAGLSAAQGVIAVLTVPSELAGSSGTLVMELWDEVSGSPVWMTGDTTEGNPLRVEHPLALEAEESDQPWIRRQVVMSFPMGLALMPGAYAWRVSLDGLHRRHWTARFQVPAVTPS